MLILQMASIGVAALLVLFVHRAGVALSLRAIGSFFWALASAIEYGKQEFKDSFHKCMERAR